MTPFANMMRQHLLTQYAPKAQLYASSYGQGQPGDAREIRSGPDYVAPPPPDPTPPPATDVAPTPKPSPSPIPAAVGDVSGLGPPPEDGPVYDPAHGSYDPAWIAAIHGGGGLAPGDPGYTPPVVHSSYAPGTVFTPGLGAFNPDGSPATMLAPGVEGPVLGATPAPAPAPAPAPTPAPSSTFDPANPVYGPETGVYSPAWVDAMRKGGLPVPGDPTPAPVAPVAPAAVAPAAPDNGLSLQDAKDAAAAARARRNGTQLV